MTMHFKDGKERKEAILKHQLEQSYGPFGAAMNRMMTSEEKEQKMHPYIVFVKHVDEEDCFLYTVHAQSAAAACVEVWESFVAEYCPENYHDYRVKAFNPVFSPLPIRIARVDREV